MTTDQTAIPPGMPGHGGGTASIRRQPVRTDDDGMSGSGYNDVMEVICPACGDRTDLDYAKAPAEIQKIRRPYGDREAALTALELHIGLNTERIRRPLSEPGLG